MRGVPLHAHALEGDDSFVGRGEHHLAAAPAAHVRPADRAHEIAGRTADADLRGDAKRDEAVHDFPGRVLSRVERPSLIGAERPRDPSAEILEPSRGGRRGAGRLEPRDDERRCLATGGRGRGDHGGLRPLNCRPRLRLVGRIGGVIDDLAGGALQRLPEGDRVGQG